MKTSLILNLRVVIILLMFAFSTTTKSQLVELLPQNNPVIKASPNLYGFFTKEKTSIFHSDITTKDKVKTYSLERYNNNLTVAFKQSFTFELKENVDYFEVKQNKIFLFTTIYDGVDKALFLRVLDYNTGKVITDKKKLTSLASDAMGTNGRNFIVRFTPDESKILIISAFQWPKNHRK